MAKQVAKKVRVRVKNGFRHTLLPENYDPEALPKGAPGKRAVAGDEIEVSAAELESFSDKFELL